MITAAFMAVGRVSSCSMAAFTGLVLYFGGCEGGLGKLSGAGRPMAKLSPGYEQPWSLKSEAVDAGGAG